MADPDQHPHATLLDLDRERQRIASLAADDLAPAMTWLPLLWRVSLLRCCLRSQADSYPDALLVLLVQCGRPDEALALAEHRTDPDRRTEALARIASELAIAGQPAAAEAVLGRVLVPPASTAAEQTLNRRPRPDRRCGRGHSPDRAVARHPAARCPQRGCSGARARRAPR